MGSTGLEPVAESPTRGDGRRAGGAESGAAGILAAFPELVELVQVWPQLSESERRGLVARVRAGVQHGNT